MSRKKGPRSKGSVIYRNLQESPLSERGKRYASVLSPSHQERDENTGVRRKYKPGTTLSVYAEGGEPVVSLRKS